ncbi:biotin carboxyl carrier protein [Pseudacidovorax sp. 1753]|jgi:acetyl-CoA carboxylase biotin carboxyl carrier protein|uniref:acetyl-CoA carboxylase biotin carboxyl carrier protein subunit n=1 Tax=unclassified Pseudacidovorax TaxID=2620592 RepID=UPI001B74462C|nr:acetyl-CoA carboxylase biotin carboxyl carrier protein subunit [Pseudacidovorax sp.]MBP6896826.1 acetyl-CoA carboxylase biotin carboxyl carrier protein subunit [Pseudacidovorax sp.]
MNTTLQSEVTGTVWKIEVQEGDTVQPDQSLLVLESMKMEIPVCAPAAGVVRQLLVKEGEAVAEGQPVVVLG